MKKDQSVNMGSGIKNFIKRFFKSREVGMLFVLIVIGIFLTILTPRFISISNLTNVARQMAVIAIIAVGTTYVIITAGIDLSVGSIVAFAGCITAVFIVDGYPIWQCILIGLFLGTLVGLVNGLLVVYMKLAPFIATLGTMGIARGLVLALTRGYPIQPFPKSFEFIGRGYVWEIPIPVIIMLVIVVIGQFILSRTKFGRYVYYVGSNPTAARLSGLNVNRTLLFVYTIAGFLAGLSSVLLISRLTSAQSNMGSEFALDAIAAVVIGGTSLSGGEGSVWGSLIGAALMGVIRNALILLGVNVYWQSVAIGLVIVGAVSIDAIRQKKVQINLKGIIQKIFHVDFEKATTQSKRQVVIFVIGLLVVASIVLVSIFRSNSSSMDQAGQSKTPIAPTTMPVEINIEKLFSKQEPVIVCDNKLTLKDVAINDSDRESRDLLVIDVEIVNQSEGQVPINSFDFTVVDSKGDVYTDVAEGKIPNALGGIRLDATLTASGALAFYIPEDDMQVKLIWQPGWCTGVAYIELFEE